MHRIGRRCSSPEVTLVLITSPDAMHWDDTLLALRYGKAVLCEKPVAMNAAEAEECRPRPGRLGSLRRGANFRFNRSLEWMRQQIAAGRSVSAACPCTYSYPATQARGRGLWILHWRAATIADVGCIASMRCVMFWVRML